MNYANLLYKKGSYTEAVNLYQRANCLNPKNEESLLGIGNCFYKTDNKDESIKSYDEVLALNPNNQVALFNKGLILYEKGDNDGANQLFEQANKVQENKNNNKEKRIVVITDDVYNDKDDKLFNLIKEYVENNNISLTIMAISSSANLTLADKICHLKGCNYFTITNCSELETYLVKNFNYIFADSLFESNEMLVQSSEGKSFYLTKNDISNAIKKKVEELNIKNFEDFKNFMENMEKRRILF